MRASDFVRSYFDAWNHRDSQSIADHLTKDGIYRDIPQNIQRTHNELVSFLNEFFADHRHRYELIGDILVGNDTIAFQYRITPERNTGVDDRQHAYRGAEFMTIHGNAAMTITDYYDMPDIARRPAKISDVATAGVSAPKYAKSGLSDVQLNDYKARLENVMQDEQLFLRSDLTLPMLADAVGCSVNHLSQVINSGFSMSFFDYLNRYRIDHATKLLSRLDDRNNAILNIAFTVGFNSNSAFYAAFKKCVGQTPAQYRRAQLRNSH
jgi:AraC-like DNA-binding protein/nuclear transport factor 2 (NTF2) superfamily protein